VTPKHIAIVGYDNLTSLDLSGPLEAFSSACIEDSKGNRRACYKVTIAALGAKTFCSVSGLCMTAACHLDTLRYLDTLLIPGGSGMRNSAAAQNLAYWISRHEHRIRRTLKHDNSRLEPSTFDWVRSGASPVKQRTPAS